MAQAVSRETTPFQHDFGPAMQLSSVASLTDTLLSIIQSSTTPKPIAPLTTYPAKPCRVKAHIVAAADDPIIPAHFYEQLPDSVTVDLIDRGGHGVFLENWQLDSWIDRYSCQFFDESSGVNPPIYAAVTKRRSIPLPRLPGSTRS